MQDSLDLILMALNLPLVRSLSLLLSVAGFAIGLYSLRKVHQVAHAQVGNMRAEHSRYLNDKRNEIERLTLADGPSAELVAETFGLADARAAQREALLCLYLNVLASAYAAYKNDLIDKAEYRKHMLYFFDDYNGDPDYLWSVIQNNYYVPGFEAECRKFMKQTIAQRSAAPQEQSRDRHKFAADAYAGR
jgi:hypothetical protein